MKTVYVSFGAIILCWINNFISAKPVVDEKSFSEDNKLHCMDCGEGSEYERNNPNTYIPEYYNRPHKFDAVDKFLNRPLEYNQKRSLSDELYNVENNILQKRQVGVIYKDDKPIGILQPYQRSYRFIPVKDDNSYGIDANPVAEVSYNTPSITGIDKREAVGTNLQELYPSILTNFKIDNKLDKKRNNYDTFTDENVRDLKATIRRLRSSNNPHNNERIEEELKNILDDMGLIDDEETHAEKREIIEDQKDDEEELTTDEDAKYLDRNKRDGCGNNENVDSVNKSPNTDSEHNLLNEKKNDIKNDFTHVTAEKRKASEETDEEKSRKKRQKQNMELDKEHSDLVENLKDSGDLMVSGNKSPLASSSEITVRDTASQDMEEKLENDDSDYEKRVERQIQSKINSLKEEVKREIEALKKKQDEDDSQRKKRQITENLVEEETEELDPNLNLDGELLKPLIRKRRDATTFAQNEESNPDQIKSRKNRESESSHNRKKRRSDHSVDNHNDKKNYKSHHEESDVGGDLLGGDDFEESSLLKRHAVDTNGQYDLEHEDPSLNEALYERGKRSQLMPKLDLYENENSYSYNSYDDDNERLKRQNFEENEDFPEKNENNRFVSYKVNQFRPRYRRRLNEDGEMANRPQQLSDMSDLDLFGALPKSYGGELSRYKRVKRK